MKRENYYTTEGPLWSGFSLAEEDIEKEGALQCPHTNETAEEICKQHSVFRTQVGVGSNCAAEFTQKLPRDTILQLRCYFHRSMSTFTVQYEDSIVFLKTKIT